jgi:hypothetical protein
MMKGQGDIPPLPHGGSFMQPAVKKIYTKLQCIPSFISNARNPYAASGDVECTWLSSFAEGWVSRKMDGLVVS